MLLRKFLPLTIILVLIPAALNAQHEKKLTIRGLRVFTERELFSQLQLNRFEEGKIPLAEVIASIEKYYKQKNYTMVRVYSTDIRTSGEYALFVDEGRLGRIIVHNLSKYYSLKFKQQIDIPGRIYNTDILNLTMKKLKDKFPSSSIRMVLQKPPDYEGNLIQLDRELQRLKLGEIIDITFFDRYIPLHDLHFYVENYRSDNIFSSKSEGLGYDIEYKFPSIFVPELFYTDENLLFGKDYFESKLSAGYDPGLSGFFDIHPSNTLVFPPVRRFIELTGEYKISPMKNDFIGPLLRWRLYHSNTARPDLRIAAYKFLNTRGTLAPEITLLNNFNIYAGIGIEQVYIYDSIIDESTEKHINNSDGFYRSYFGEARLKFDPIPIRIGNRIDKYMILTYTDYLSGNSAREIDIKGAYDAEFENMSILSLKVSAVLLFDDPSFYHSESINSAYFKGFTGKSYFSNRELSVSTEYRFSLYQDYLYAGIFFDWVVFEPEGYDLSGTKQGIVYGPTGRFLIYDQFEFIVHFGFDRLLPDQIKGTNLKMRFAKKW